MVRFVHLGAIVLKPHWQYSIKRDDALATAVMNLLALPPSCMGSSPCILLVLSNPWNGYSARCLLALATMSRVVMLALATMSRVVMLLTCLSTLHLQVYQPTCQMMMHMPTGSYGKLGGKLILRRCSLSYMPSKAIQNLASSGKAMSTCYCCRIPRGKCYCRVQQPLFVFCVCVAAHGHAFWVKIFVLEFSQRNKKKDSFCCLYRCERDRER